MTKVYNIVGEFIRNLEEAVDILRKCKLVSSANDVAWCREETGRVNKEMARLHEEYRSMKEKT